jgi:hypothetical protein
MKKQLTRVLFAMIAFSLMGCGSGFQPRSATYNNQTPPAQLDIPPGSPGDPVSPRVEVPNMAEFIRQFSDQHPGLINDCMGRPIANDFLIGVVRELQRLSPRWGFFRKPDGRIPRDILAFAWGSESEGTHNTFVIDIVSDGCSNDPQDPAFNNYNPNARPFWNVTNPDGYADNGVWTANP